MKKNKCTKCKNWTVSTTPLCLNCQAELSGDFTRTKEDECTDIELEGSSEQGKCDVQIDFAERDKIRGAVWDICSKYDGSFKGIYKAPLSGAEDRKYKKILNNPFDEIILAIELQVETGFIKKEPSCIAFTSEGLYWSAITEFGNSNNCTQRHLKGFLPYSYFPFLEFNVDTLEGKLNNEVYSVISIRKSFDYNLSSDFLDDIICSDGIDEFRIVIKRLLSFTDQYIIEDNFNLRKSTETSFAVGLSTLFMNVKLRIINIKMFSEDETRSQAWPKRNIPEKYTSSSQANRSLALRYGLVNNDKDSILLKRLGTIESCEKGMLCFAELTEFNNRKVKALILSDSLMVQDFRPFSDDWFDKYADIELVLEGNDAFQLRDLARIHVQLLIDSKKNSF